MLSANYCIFDNNQNGNIMFIISPRLLLVMCFIYHSQSACAQEVIYNVQIVHEPNEILQVNITWNKSQENLAIHLILQSCEIPVGEILQDCGLDSSHLALAVTDSQQQNVVFSNLTFNTFYMVQITSDTEVTQKLFFQTPTCTKTDFNHTMCFDQFDKNAQSIVLLVTVGISLFVILFLVCMGICLVKHQTSLQDCWHQYVKFLFCRKGYKPIQDKQLIMPYKYEPNDDPEGTRFMKDESPVFHIMNAKRDTVINIDCSTKYSILAI